MMKTATESLDSLEKQGVFAFGRELLEVGKKVVQHYSADDVRALGDSVVSILDTVRALTQPEVLNIASEASEVLQHSESAKPVGLFGMMRATRNEDVGRGISVMLEVMKKVGRGAAVLARQQDGKADQRAKMTALLAPRRRALPATTTPVKVKAPVVQSSVPADSTPVDPTAWTKALGEQLAAQQAVLLTDAHWAVIDFARKDYWEMKASPNIRRITQGTGMQTKDLYTLFPKAPARTVAKIAGIPKPAGCI
jgi:tRNA 2-thiouridine synthesizing protein E